jgi:hypothetical protein
MKLMVRTIAPITDASGVLFGIKLIDGTMGNMVQISSGLLAYFNDSKTESAVDLLLAKKRPSIPDDVNWSDVPDYFRALRAARQIQADFAILLHEIWNAIWTPLPVPWTADAPHEQIDDGFLDPRTIWDHWYALRGYGFGKLSSELLVYADKEAGVQIGFNVLLNSKSKLKGPIKGWEKDEVTFWSSSGLVKIQKDLKLAPLEPFAAEALKIIKSVGKQP